MIKIITTQPEKLYQEIADTTYRVLSLQGEGMVELDFVSRQEIHEVNNKERNVDKETDVLSFPALDEILPFTQENYPYEYDNEQGGVHIGSIIICEEIALNQAKEYGHSEIRERAYLFLHGLLHLLGYDHIKEEDKVIMREKEEKILSELDIKR